MSRLDRFVDAVRSLVHLFPAALARLGLVEAHRGEETTDLALPRIVTGLARQSQRTVDLIMIGAAVGPAGIAGLALAAPFWGIAGGLGSGITNGAVGLISQRYGAEEYGRMNLAIKQTLLLTLLLTLPLGVGFVVFAERLIGLFGVDPASTRYGVTYLRVVSTAVVVTCLNKVATRTLVSAGDAWIEMVVRVTGSLVNIALNVVFIFGLGMGVFGAALGTVLAKAFVLGIFSAGFLRGRFPGIGAFPTRLSPTPEFDAGLFRQLVEVSAPLIVRQLAQRFARFPLLAIVANFGTVVVAAYGISRRIYFLLRTPNWGLSLAASSLVGQRLGADEEREAAAYGWDIIRFAAVVYLLGATAAFVFAHALTRLFTTDPATVAATVPFVRVIAVGTVLMGLDGVATGILRAGGDTRWPMYGRFVGLYLLTLPVAYLAVVTPLGVVALYAALLSEALVPALVSCYRFTTGRWLEISRSYRPSSG
ncbi:MAG: MATE family efflux transporter [Haloferacaceae archaeon]